MQEEAYKSKRRDLAVLAANDGVWPGVRTPSHALFLWASGSELTSILEADHMPNKYIPKDLRYIESFHFATFFFLLLMSETYNASPFLPTTKSNACLQYAVGFAFLQIITK